MLPKFHRDIAAALAAILLVSLSAPAKSGKKEKNGGGEIDVSHNAVLWSAPDDIKSRNLYYGPGGEQDEPHTVYTFEVEDMKGTNPKFVVHDENGVKWKVKMGYEARPETVASRLVWAVGYNTNEDYFLPEMHVEGMPAHLAAARNTSALRGLSTTSG